MGDRVEEPEEESRVRVWTRDARTHTVIESRGTPMLDLNKESQVERT